MNYEHGLPVPELDPRETNPSTPILNAVKGGINYNEFEPQVNDLHIMEYLFRKRSETEDVIRKHTNKFPQKVQLMVGMTLQKPTDEEPEKVTVYFNTHTTTVLQYWLFWHHLWRRSWYHSVKTCLIFQLWKRLAATDHRQINNKVSALCPNTWEQLHTFFRQPHAAQRFESIKHSQLKWRDVLLVLLHSRISSCSQKREVGNTKALLQT